MSRISARFHAAELPRAVHKYNQQASYQFASVENAPCAESDRPACVRKRPQPPTPVLTAPTTSLSHDSSDSAHLACAGRDLHPPTLSTDAPRARSSGTV